MRYLSFVDAERGKRIIGNILMQQMIIAEQSIELVTILNKLFIVTGVH